MINPTTAHFLRKQLIFCLLVMGASGIIAQILLLRELLVTFYGNELSIGIILANWLILEAFGSFFLGKRIEQFKRRIEAFVCLQLIFSLSLPIAIYLTRILKEVIGVPTGEGLGLIPIFYSSFLVLLGVSISHGALFTFGCKLYSLNSKADAKSISKVYIYETLGTIVGGISLTYLLIPYLHSFQIALGVSLLNFLLCVYLLRFDTQILTTKILIILSLIFSLLTGFLIFSGKGDKIHWLSLKKQWKEQKLIHYQNSIYGNLAVIEREGEYTFFADGIPIITTPTPDIVLVEEFAHLPMLSHLRPKDILVISGGAGGIINEILKHPSVEKIDYVELDPLLLKIIRQFPTPLTETELNNPRVNIEYLDGRLFLKRTPHKYDLIFLGFSLPLDLQVNRLFTKEFFSLVKKRLKEEGILVMRLPGSLTYLSRELKNLNACIINTLKEIYSYIRIIPGESTNLFLASESKEISLIEPIRLTQRLKERKLNVSLLTQEHIEYKLHPRWLNWFLKSLQEATEKINQDFQPLGLFFSLSYWNALFSPYMRMLLQWFEKINLFSFFILVLILTLVLIICFKAKRLFRINIPLCITTTGFAGMLFDLVLIFTFQVFYGYVFAWIGILVTAFMTGATAGAMLITTLLSRIKNDLASFLKIELGIISFSGILPLVFLFFSSYLEKPVVFVLLHIVFLILSFLSGFLVGGQFPLANKIYLASSADFAKTAGLLYGSDLFGGWLAGIIGGIVLLPVLGIFRTCMVIVILKISSFILLTTSVVSNKR